MRSCLTVGSKGGCWTSVGERVPEPFRRPSPHGGFSKVFLQELGLMSGSPIYLMQSHMRTFVETIVWIDHFPYRWDLVETLCRSPAIRGPQSRGLGIHKGAGSIFSQRWDGYRRRWDIALDIALLGSGESISRALFSFSFPFFAPQGNLGRSIVGLCAFQGRNVSLWPSRPWSQLIRTQHGGTSCVRQPSWASLITTTLCAWKVLSQNVRVQSIGMKIVSDGNRN